MKLREAIAATHKVYVGVEARTIKRKDRRGRVWFLVTSRGNHFLIRPDKTAYKRVSQEFADNWDDWEPQSECEAKKESDFMNSSRGLSMRNRILGLVMGPLPTGMKAPSFLPDDI